MRSILFFVKEVLTVVHFPEIYPAHAAKPFVRPHGKGLIFSAVFPKGMECGLQLIHIPDGETLYIPFRDEFRVGRICSVMLTPLDPNEWMYRYKSGDFWIPDPHAFSIGKVMIREGDDKEEITACSCSPIRAGDLFEGAPEKPLPPADWSKQVIYGLHIRGFSAARESLDEKLRGTFAGAAAGISYLKDLGITAVEIMPVYTPLPESGRKKTSGPCRKRWEPILWAPMGTLSAISSPAPITGGSDPVFTVPSVPNTVHRRISPAWSMPSIRRGSA